MGVLLIRTFALLALCSVAVGSTPTQQGGSHTIFPAGGAFPGHGEDHSQRQHIISAADTDELERKWGFNVSFSEPQQICR